MTYLYSFYNQRWRNMAVKFIMTIKALTMLNEAEKNTVSRRSTLNVSKDVKSNTCSLWVSLTRLNSARFTLNVFSQFTQFKVQF